MHTTSQPSLHLQREVHGLSVVVRAFGEIDQDTVAALTHELRVAIALATRPFPVVVDLSGVTFLGSSGLNDLVRHHQHALAARTPLRLVAAHRAVLRPVSAAGLEQVLELYPDLDQALLVQASAKAVG